MQGNHAYKQSVLIIAVIVAMIVGLAAGIPIGDSIGKTSALSEQTSELIAQKNKEYQDLSSKLQEAEKTISTAESYDIETLKQQQEQLVADIEAKQQKLDQLSGNITRELQDTVPNGTWQVGSNMKAGKYRATEDVSGMDCSYTVYIDEALWTREYDRDILQFDAPQGGYPEFTAEDKQEVRIKNCPTFKRID